MKLTFIIFIIILIFLIFFVFLGQRIAVNLFTRGANNITNILLVGASSEDSIRITYLKSKLIYTFKKGRVNQKGLKKLVAMVDTTLLDSLLFDEEREKLLILIDSLVR